MRDDEELTRLIAEQSALRRVATLVAAGIGERELVDALTSEIGSLFGAQRANTMRCAGDAIEVIGEWSSDGQAVADGQVFEYGGDTLVMRVVGSRTPARVVGASDFQTDFARERWRELGIEASIAAPIVVGGAVWGVVTASRTTRDDPFPEGAETRLSDFAALAAQSIVNAQARGEATALAEEQAALRRVATLVAAGRPQDEVVEAVTREAAGLFEAENVSLMRWEGVQDEVVVVGGWSGGDESPIAAGSLYHPAPGSPTLRVLETGYATRKDEISGELGARFAISAPVIVGGRLWGALTALRAESPFSGGSEVRLRSFADLAAQSVANALAQEEMRASRARIVRAGDEARERLERNLHDGAQQRLVAVSISLRLATARLPEGADEARSLLTGAAEELTHAIDELRVLARGIHPAVLTDRGLGAALEVLTERTLLPVTIANELPTRLPAAVEAAAYYVVAESLTNIARYANASTVQVRLARVDGFARVEVVDDGVGGADPSRGTGLRGLADRVEALDGRLGFESPPSAGTRVWAEIPLLHSD
ncbi:MAG TPA: GAF domain-containing protein [Gaiellaceae bacterium]|nr:GAF domain-containing protein [Gaiellaceae bacterium]